MSGSNRKFGRCKKRPSNQRYTAEKRWEKNKKLSIAREANRQAKAANRKAKRAGRVPSHSFA
jgi:hypothetical protein